MKRNESSKVGDVTTVDIWTLNESRVKSISNRSIASIGKSIGSVVWKTIETITAPHKLSLSVSDRHRTYKANVRRCQQHQK